MLVILGLLTGGILGGQSLIRAAELRAVSTEYSRYTTAIQVFRDKYFALPGDMNNAAVFWGTAANCPGNATQGSTSATTCNGDGNGQVNWWASASNESFRFWQHLANAGLLEGAYSGVTGNDTYGWSSSPSNSPRSKLSPAIWQISYANNSMGTFTGVLFNYDFGNALFLGVAASPSTWNYAPALKPEEAWNIDTKMDDGKPGVGKITSYVSANCSTSSPTDYDASYALSVNSLQCILIFGYL
ncbi:hypothetical protein [Novosphingobium sp. B1]|uniref:hypothetical protein n=1 Tax=Novosphingobium sp. B1 TaxID=1938756 RepID=UPI001C38085D|nr:hypothetical protein [Novosphingobium sp. B1]